MIDWVGITKIDNGFTVTFNSADKSKTIFCKDVDEVLAKVRDELTSEYRAVKQLVEEQ